MYHPYRKDSSYLRDALYKEYKKKCQYCGNLILQIRYMHVDHILPTNRPETMNRDAVAYIKELEDEGFIQDSIENYLPSCSSCNIAKSNQIFTVSSCRYYHEIARTHVSSILEIIDTLGSGTVRKM